MVIATPAAPLFAVGENAEYTRTDGVTIAVIVVAIDAKWGNGNKPFILYTIRGSLKSESELYVNEKHLQKVRHYEV